MIPASFSMWMSVDDKFIEQNESFDDNKVITQINKSRSLYTNEWSLSSWICTKASNAFVPVMSTRFFLWMHIYIYIPKNMYIYIYTCSTQEQNNCMQPWQTLNTSNEDHAWPSFHRSTLTQHSISSVGRSIWNDLSTRIRLNNGITFLLNEFCFILGLILTIDKRRVRRGHWLGALKDFEVFI